MAALIDSRADWWRFPQEEVVQGFMGTGEIFIVGDQPSTSSWELEHPNRRVFYESLSVTGFADAHLTDLYKRRGKAGTLRCGIPPDFSKHVEFFRKELAILRPTRVVALGDLAYQLLSQHVPEVRPILTKIWHFAYVARYKKQATYVNQMREAFKVGSQWQPNATQPANAKVASRTLVYGGPENENMSIPDMLMAIQAPRGVRVRRWTLRNDNKRHHHGIVRLSESPLYLNLSWRPTAVDPPQRVGTFLLDLDALLRAGCIRSESPSSERTELRLRITRAEDDNFYIQALPAGARIQLVAD